RLPGGQQLGPVDGPGGGRLRCRLPGEGGRAARHGARQREGGARKLIPLGLVRAYALDGTRGLGQGGVGDPRLRPHQAYPTTTWPPSESCTAPPSIQRTPPAMLNPCRRRSAPASTRALVPSSSPAPSNRALPSTR